MRCSECDRPIAVDQLRCDHCGHDMLPEDIARRPIPEPTPAAAREAEFLAGLLLEKERLAASVPTVTPSRHDAAQLALATEEMKRNRWRLLPLVASAILLAMLFFFLRPR